MSDLEALARQFVEAANAKKQAHRALAAAQKNLREVEKEVVKRFSAAGVNKVYLGESLFLVIDEGRPTLMMALRVPEDICKDPS
jgi:accessory colonization factor AcfC